MGNSTAIAPLNSPSETLKAASPLTAHFKPPARSRSDSDNSRYNVRNAKHDLL